MELQIFQHFKISNIKIKTDELFDFLFSNLFLIFLFVQIIRTIEAYDNLAY